MWVHKRVKHTILHTSYDWINKLDNPKCCDLLTDLSKDFGCVKHGLLIAKMLAYNYDHDALALICSDLSEPKQRTEINASFSTWYDIYT